MNEQDLWLALNDLEEELILEPVRTQHLLFAKKRFLTLLIAAALVLSMSLTVFATTSRQNRTIFSASVRNPDFLPQEQADSILHNGMPLQQSISQNGYTLTLVSALVDKYDAYLYLTLEAPEGTSLNALRYTGSQIYAENGRPILPLSRPDGKDFGWSGNYIPVEDRDIQDNRYSFIFEIHLSQGSSVNFLSDGLWNLHFQDIQAHYVNKISLFGKYHTKVVAAGTWSFDLDLHPFSDQELEFIDQPIAYRATARRTRDEILSVKTSITSIKLRALSANISFDGYMESHQFQEFKDLTIVTKDGTQQIFTLQGSTNGTNQYISYIPIRLAQVDHILLEDGTKLYPLCR